jgi:hypothetical protein
MIKAGPDLRRVAIIGFAAGVVFHACVAMAVLGGGGGSGGSNVAPAAPVTQRATPVATPTDRTSCEAIRGTDYRSETERQWFQRNCTGASAPPGEGLLGPVPADQAARL